MPYRYTEYQKQWRELHKEEYLIYCRRYYRLNKHGHRRMMIKWEKSHPSNAPERLRRWRKKHPELYIKYNIKDCRNYRLRQKIFNMERLK